MLRSFLKGAKFRAWLSQPECPSAIKECKVLLDRAYNMNDGHDIDPFDDNVKPADAARRMDVLSCLRELTSQPTTILHAHLKYSGVTYSRSSTHLGNSQVMFYPDGNRSLAGVPGVIQYIYEEDGAMMFAVQRQATFPIQNACKLNAFVAYPHFPARIYSMQLKEKLEHVKISWVIGHNASYVVSSNELVILSLSQVSQHFVDGIQ